MPPILVRLPPHLDELVDQHRGELTRAAFLTTVLAAHLGVGLDVPKRGRPKKARPVASTDNMDCVVIPEIGRLVVVRWYDKIESVPYHSTPESPRTLYISNNNNRIQFAYSEKDTATGKAISRIIKRNGGRWSGFFWEVGEPDTIDKVRKKANDATPPWSIAALEDIKVTGWSFAKLRGTIIHKTFIVLSIDCSPLIDFGQRHGREVRAFLTHMYKMSEVFVTTWFFDRDCENFIFSMPIELSAVEYMLKSLQDTHHVKVEISNASASDLRAWAAQPVLMYSEHGMVNADVRLGNPLHRFLLYKAAAATKPGHEVGPSLILEKDQWKELAHGFEAVGGSWQERAHPSRFSEIILRPEEIPGWERPAKNSYTLFQHQREGIQFLLDHHMRALLGDEMGLGKTGTVIGAAVACCAKRVLVIAPAAARSVWDSEIRGWAGDDRIIHVDESLYDADLPPSAWVILTYDLLTPRAESFSPPDTACATWLHHHLSTHGCRLSTLNSSPKAGKLPSIRFDPRTNPEIGNLLLNLPAPSSGCISQKTLDKLHRIGRRLAADLSAKILAWDPDLVCVDEAHRIKNSGAGRTRAVRALIEDKTRGAVLITGTPLRNHEGEGVNLIEALAPGVKARLTQTYAKGYWRSAQKEAAEKAVGGLLKAIMIRRLKGDVLNLPDKIRQWVEIVPHGPNLIQYRDLMSDATEKMAEAIEGGMSQAEATKGVLGLLAKARRLLGSAKIANPATADLIDEIVDEKSACLVFAAHHEVIDDLANQLRKLGRSVVTVDGRTPHADRASAAAQLAKR